MRILFVVYDNEASHNHIPLGTLYIASYLRKYGYTDIQFFSQDIYRYPDEYLTEYLTKEQFDIVAMGFVAGYHQHSKVISIMKAINGVRNRPFVVLGGHGPTPVPEFYLTLTDADAVVMGEGEKPFLNLIKAIDAKQNLKNVKGIAFRDGARVVVNEREIPIRDLSTIPFPYYEALNMEYYVNTKFLDIKPTDRMISMISGRGCNYKCNFCLRLEKGIRLREPEEVVEEIKKYIKDYRITYIVFWDELFMFSEERVADLCEAILRENIKIRYWCTGRLNIVNERILKLMKKSGCSYIDYGIEQFDNIALEAMNKRLTESEIVNGIEITQKEDILVAFNIIFGNIGDTEESLNKSMQLLSKYNDYGQLRVIRPVTPYPGTPLFYEAIKRELLTGPDDFYKKHRNVELLTVNFTDIPDAKFYELMFKYNTQIIEDYYNQTKKLTIDTFEGVYFRNEYAYRGARHN